MCQLTDNLYDGRYYNGHAQSAITGRKTGQEEPHHAGPRDHRRCHSDGLRNKIPLHGIELLLWRQVEKVSAETPMGAHLNHGHVSEVEAIGYQE